MTVNDERIPFENNDDENSNDDRHQINIENVGSGNITSSSIMHSSSSVNNNILNNGEQYYSESQQQAEPSEEEFTSEDFSDIRLSASNRDMNLNKHTTTTTTTSTNNDIELEDLGKASYDGAILNNNNNNNNINNQEEDVDDENKKMLSNTDEGHEDDEDEDETLAKKKKEEDESPPAPIPRHIWIRVLLIYYAVFSDGLSLTLIQPFLPNILTDRWGFAQEDVGYVSGILVGVYSFARFGSGFYLGHLSDKYGRKWFLVTSLLVTGIGTILFAVMPNIWLAVGLRIVEGLLSNTTSLCQATLADMVDKKNRAAVFAYLGGTYALSRCISSSMGGFIVKIFENTSNPYMYPCVIGGVIVLLSAVLLLFCHPETHPKYTKLDYGHHYKELQQQREEDDDNKGIQSSGEPKKDKTFKEGMTIILKDRGLVLLMVVGGLNSFNNGGLLLSLVLFSSLSLDKRGLGFDSMGSGIIFTILGFFGFLWQVLLFKKVSSRFGLKKQYTAGMILLSVGMALFPLSYVAWYIQGTALAWVTIAIVVPIISVGFMSGLPIVQGMVANCSNPEIQGLTQGSTQSINSMLRSFGPAISGAIFSVSSTHGAPWVLFIVLSCIYVSVSVISLYLPDKVDINHLALKKNSLERSRKKMERKQQQKQ